MSNKYKCKGGRGCKKAGCELVLNGRPEDPKEKLYMCPFNHWRFCEWVLLESEATK